MSDKNVVEHQKKRMKFECLECGNQFNHYFKKNHKEKLRREKRINVKHVGAFKILLKVQL